MPSWTLSLWSLVLLAGGGGPRPRAPLGTSLPIQFGFTLALAEEDVPVEELVPEEVVLTGFVAGDVGMTMEAAVAVPASVKVEGEPLALEEEIPDTLFVGGGGGEGVDDPFAAVVDPPDFLLVTQEEMMCEDDEGNAYKIGDDINGGPIEVVCSDYERMEGVREICTGTGKIEKEEYEFVCPKDKPVCVQENDAALPECFNETEAKKTIQQWTADFGDGDLVDDGETTTTTMTAVAEEQPLRQQDESDDGACEVGELRFARGESVGYKGIWCRQDDPDGRKFEGEESICDGGIIVEDDNDHMTCPEDRPHCVQCGWEARCVWDLATVDPTECKGVGVGANVPVKCEVNGIGYDVGDAMPQKTVLSCIDEGTYNGTESVCGTDGSMFERSVQLQCGVDKPYCIQCSDGADALCLSEKRNCTDDSGESSESEESTSSDKQWDEVILDGNMFDSVPRTSNGATTAASTSGGVASVRLDSATRLLSWFFACFVPPLLCLLH